MGNPRSIKVYCTYRRDVKSEELGETVNGPRGKGTREVKIEGLMKTLPIMET